MQSEVNQKENLNRIITVPNLLSFFRLCLIPVIIWSYCVKKNPLLAGEILLLSGLTDLADGYIARRFHRISNLGKILDPVADKLTQAAMLICLFLFQKEKLHLQVRKVIFAFIPKQKADAILNICSLTYRTFANFLAGQCLEAVILGMMFVITLSILKMPYALLIGILIAFTALVPIFGAFIGCAVGSFLIFMVNPKQAVLFIIVFLLLQQIEGNLIYPHVVGGSVGLPSIWVLAAVTIGGNLMGIIGMLIFIPLVSVFYTIFREFVYLRLKKQHIKRVTRTDVEEYAEEEIASSFIVPNEK